MDSLKKLDQPDKPKWWRVVDYKRLNDKTVDDKYSIPQITDLSDKVGKTDISKTDFSTLNTTNLDKCPWDSNFRELFNELWILLFCIIR